MTTVDPAEARDAADAILSRPEYREPPRSLVDRALDWIGDRLGDVLSSFFGGDRGLIVGYLILAAAIVVALYLAWRFFPRRLRVNVGSRPEVVTETTVRRSRDDWLELARGAAAAGRWDEAVHARYHAITAGLADTQELSPDPAVTSGEHRRAFSRSAAESPERYRRFDEVVARYEEIWFGQDAAGRSDVEAAAEADEVLLGTPS